MNHKDELTISSFRLLKNGIEAIGEPNFTQWKKCGEFIKKAGGAVHFWMGDWLVYGENHYADMYTQLIDETGYDIGTLQDDKWVSERIPYPRRRGLSFSHHREVATLEAEEQDVLLDQAVKENLTREQFRRVVRAYRLRIEVPELSEKQLGEAQNPSKDYETVEEIIKPSLTMLEKLERVEMDTLVEGARDYLLSHLRKAVGLVGNFLLKHDQQK